MVGNVGSYNGEGKGHWIYGARWLVVEVVRVEEEMIEGDGDREDGVKCGSRDHRGWADDTGGDNGGVVMEGGHTGMVVW